MRGSSQEHGGPVRLGKQERLTGKLKQQGSGPLERQADKSENRTVEILATFLRQTCLEGRGGAQLQQVGVQLQQAVGVQLQQGGVAAHPR